MRSFSRKAQPRSACAKGRHLLEAYSICLTARALGRATDIAYINFPRLSLMCFQKKKIPPAKLDRVKVAMVMSTEQCYQGDTGWKEVAALMVPHSQCTFQGTKITKKRAIWHLPIYALWAPDKKSLNRDGRKSRCGSC